MRNMAESTEKVIIGGNEYRKGDAIRLGLLPPTDGPENPSATPTVEWTGAQIDAFAAEHGIDFGSASTKAEKVAVIERIAGREIDA